MIFRYKKKYNEALAFIEKLNQIIDKNEETYKKQSNEIYDLLAIKELNQKNIIKLKDKIEILRKDAKEHAKKHIQECVEYERKIKEQDDLIAELNTTILTQKRTIDKQTKELSKRYIVREIKAPKPPKQTMKCKLSNLSNQTTKELKERSENR